MGEGGGLSRHAGHRSTQDPDLRHGHLRTRSLEVLDDGLRYGAIYSVDEHSARRADRVVVFLLRREDLRVGHRLDHVYYRCGERPKRRDDALALIDLTRVAQQSHDDELAMRLRGQERHRRCDHYVGDGRELFWSGL